jgi:hypothetical protein
VLFNYAPPVPAPATRAPITANHSIPIDPSLLAVGSSVLCARPFRVHHTLTFRCLVEGAAMALAGTGVFAEIIDGEVYKYYADREWRSSASGKSVAIINPTTGQMKYRVQGASFTLVLLLFFFHSLTISGSKHLVVLLVKC